MTQRQAEFFQVRLFQLGQDLPIDIVFGKRLSVAAQSEPVEPAPQVIHDHPLVRSAKHGAKR